jgi:hypothetical protein
MIVLQTKKKLFLAASETLVITFGSIVAMLVTRHFQRPKKSRPPDIHAAKKETVKKIEKEAGSLLMPYGTDKV